MDEVIDITPGIDTDTATIEIAQQDTIHDVMLKRIRIAARRRITWLRKLWVEGGSNDNANESFNLHSEVDGYLNNRDTVDAALNWFSQDEQMSSLSEELAVIENRLLEDNSSRLATLQAVFGLDDAEMDIIHCCLALTIDPNLGRVYAYLHDHNARGYVSNQLVARLFNHGVYIVIGSSSPLAVWNLTREIDMGRGEPARVELDPFIRNWLLGAHDFDPALAEISSIQTRHEPLSQWPLEEMVTRLRQLFSNPHSNPLRVFLAGQEGSGRRSFAASLCSLMGLKLLSINANRLALTDWQQLYMKAQRQALIDGHALLWKGDSAIEHGWLSLPYLTGLQFVVGEVDETPVPVDYMIDLRLEIPAITWENASRLWKKFVPASAIWSPEALKEIAQRHRVSIGQLVAVSKKNCSTTEEISEEIRGLSRHRLGELAKQINSSFSWDDLVIPPALRNDLDDFYFEATERTQVWEQAATKRLFPLGRGLMALFTGSPGTGKTMAAQVIANSLQLDLFRIDLSTMVSKYIGETSKNIQRILSRAERMDAVLLFDEADALFGKRTDVKDAHDRYANTDTNYLLQAIEEYPGIAILASNRKTSIDTGFTRRLRYVLEFPRPDAEQRFLLWSKLLAGLTSASHAAALDSELKRLSAMTDVTGAQIKMAVLSALYMARRDKKEITTTHLLRGLERELAKEGRGLGKQVQDVLKQQIIKEKIQGR